MDNERFATELLREIKQSAKRWFIAFCVMVGLEIGTIAGFLWYITLPVDETVIEQGVEDIDNSNINQNVGDYNGKSIPESDQNTQSNEK